MTLVVKNLPANAGDVRDVGLIPWRRAWKPTPVFLPGESHGQKSLAGHSPWGRKESDTTVATEHTHVHAWAGDHAHQQKPRFKCSPAHHGPVIFPVMWWKL